MGNSGRLIIEQLDQKLGVFNSAKNVTVPEKGWLSAIRNSLNMTLAQLGKKLNITRQGAKGIETSEANGSITINSLKDAANAMGFDLVYALVPKQGSIEALIDFKAEKLARKIVMRTHHNMVLEDQGIEHERLEKNVSELAAELKRTISKSLWD